MLSPEIRNVHFSFSSPEIYSYLFLLLLNHPLSTPGVIFPVWGKKRFASFALVKR